jgi:predicted nucleotide-binding protein (sugar kinase/HSP70/actin superfamily)
MELEQEMVYPKFTKDMKKTHTILIPSMLPIHFSLIEGVIKSEGFNVEIMQNHGPEVVEEGLKYVHNDACYPALLVIGQFIDNLNHRDDTHNVVLLITQSGGGCRASNYIHLLRKALIKAGYEYIPVISFNISNLEKDSAFQLTRGLILKLAAAIVYGEQMMYLYNKVRSYEKNKGDALKVVEKWRPILIKQLERGKGVMYWAQKKNLKAIADDFDKVEIIKEAKPKVGVVGEIYIKYASLGNNDLENLLIDEGAEVYVPGLFGYILYCLYNILYDDEYYGGISKKAKRLCKLVIWYVDKLEGIIIKSIKRTKYTPMQKFKHTKDLSEGILDHGVKMGEGWLLTAEMMELIETGYKNIVCAQPFGCLPNHICGKGVIRKIKAKFPDANISPIDYDPSATRVNQENRIKLMLSIARENLDKNIKL